MATLSSRDIGQLRSRGIEKHQDRFGVKYYLSPLGLYWLFNTLYSRDSKGKKPRLTNELLKAVANTPADTDWRALRIKASELPVYSDTVFQIAFYLNGSPPRLLQNTGSISNIVEEIHLLDRSSVLGVVEGTEVFLKLTEEECTSLKHGELIERDSKSSR